MAISTSISTTLSVVALGVAATVAGYVWFGQQTGSDQDLGRSVATLEDEVRLRTSELAAVNARLGDIGAGRQRLDDDLSQLADRVNRETKTLAVLPERLDTLEQAVARFAGTGDKVRPAWLLAEAEHYLRIANAQLGLAGDVDVAQTALGLADDALRELNDPRLMPVRKLLADEISALRAVPRPDTEGIVLSLGTLASSLDTLPLKTSAPDTFRAIPGKPAEPLTGPDRAVAVTRAALASLVSVRRVDDPVSPLLTDAEQSVLLRSLDLELQLARLAIMRGDAGMYRRSVEAATGRLREHFDLSSREVQASLATLQDLEGTALPEQLPDISGSLSALLRIVGAADSAARPDARP